jgi:hydroxycarboxylate dehydrogenase B
METAARFSASHLYSLTRRLLVAAGTPRLIAAEVAGILVNANLAGHDSHGALRLPSYLRSIEKGGMDPVAEPEVVKETAATLRVDGKNGFGHYTARRAMQWAIERAQRCDICAVSLVRTGHVGRLGEYGEQAARAGCIGIVSVGGGSRDGGQVAPFGGARGALGTNPIAVGAPTGGGPPFLMDFATSTIAAGKVQVAQSQGADLPAGCLLDRHGQPSVNPTDLSDGGFLLPFGGHKGYALSLFTCLLSMLPGSFDRERGSLWGGFMLALNVSSFTPLAEYQQDLRQFLDGIRATPPAPGFAEVLVPGDLEARTRAERLARGIQVPVSVRDQLQEWAEKLQVSMSEDAVEPSESERYRSSGE